ncbi:cell division control protein 14, SIN component-domain-containing protein [Mycena polygramma]|nr:cell division control protein 14, SIN component-domain-containing protein [Mycena polygramma]
MEDRLVRLRRALEEALDDLSSPRTSSDTKTQALRSLEKLLAAAFVPKSSTEDLDYFLALQYTFECNVPSRIMGWIISSTFRLDLLTNKGITDPEVEPEVVTLTSQLTLALSIIQGVCLTHAPTKTYLGRRYALEVLLDLFLSSRHVSSTPFAAANLSGSPVKPTPGAPLPLASVILDTLLCILVDSSPALRVFEACHGVHAVVKILKRAGTPREVRMKCLEFLYFYLLDETTSALPATTPTPTTTTTPTAPSTPMQPGKKPFITGTPARPISRYGSSTFSVTSSAFASSSFTTTATTTTSSASSSSSSSSGSGSGSTSRSTSGSSTSSFSSTSSNAGSTPRSRSPKKQPSTGKGTQTQTSTPRNTSTTATPTPQTPGAPRMQPRALLMLRKDLDFVPLSPKRAVVTGEDGAPLGKARAVGGRVARARSRLVSDEEEEDSACESETRVGDEEEQEKKHEGGREARTTDEKKELLATMLGNVEALVEGVRKAGIWGLG